MSAPNGVTPSTEHEVTKIVQNLFTTEYALEIEDQALVKRLVAYGDTKEGLTDIERTILRTRGLMDDYDQFMVPMEYIYRGVVTPAFWLKCLLALHGLISFRGDPNESTKTPSK